MDFLNFGDFESSPCLCFERALVGPVANVGPVYGDGNDDVEDMMVECDFEKLFFKAFFVDLGKMGEKLDRFSEISVVA